MKACFFSRVKDKQLFEIVDFYRNDIRILKEMGFDVVLANRFHDIPLNCDLYFTWFWGPAIFSLLKSKIARKPNIIVSPLHYYDREFGYFTRPLYERIIMHISMKLADYNLAISKIDFEGLKKLKIKKAEMIYLCVDTDFYQPGLIRNNKKNLVLSIAHLNKLSIKRKKLKLVVNSIPYVIKRFPEAKFIIAGTKEDGFEELEQLVKKLKINDAISFPGRITTQEKLQLYQRSKIFVQPSVFEAFGAAQAEAMSCGVPVITNRVGSLPELVGDCGIYISKDDPCELSKLICDLFENEILWNNLSIKGRKRIVNNFSYHLRKKKLKVIIEKIMES